MVVFIEKHHISIYFVLKVNSKIIKCRLFLKEAKSPLKLAILGEFWQHIYPKFYFKTSCVNDTIKYETQTPTTPSQFSMAVTLESPRANIVYGDSQRGVVGV